LYFFLSFIISFLFNGIKIYAKDISHILDTQEGVQKFHTGAVPRLGGLGIYLAFSVVSLYFYFSLKDLRYLYIVFTTLPVFLGGVLEDITKKISPKARLGFAIISSLVAIYIFDVYINRLDIPFVDTLLSIEILAVIFTVFALTGVSNAYNIIDGFNGLASGVAVLVLLSFVYIATKLNDIFILNISLTLIFSILGFFVWNFPFGKIFLGDGGAYFIGFVIAFISVYLVYNHTEVSPWYPLVLSIYPIFETIFSIYRRKFIKNYPSMYPDAHHLHTLLYRRLIPKIFPKLKDKSILRNSAVSSFIWLLCFFIAIIPANLFYKSTLLLVLISIIFVIIYILIYRSIVKFKIKL